MALLQKTTAFILPFGPEHAVQTSATRFKCDSSILNDTLFKMTPPQQLEAFKSWEQFQILIAMDQKKRQNNSLNLFIHSQTLKSRI